METGKEIMEGRLRKVEKKERNGTKLKKERRKEERNQEKQEEMK